MTKTKRFTLINWCIFTLLYLLFSWWNGAFEGPLNAQEIDFYIKKMKALSQDVDTSFIKKMLQKDNGRPIFMVNAIQMRDEPALVDGETAGNTATEVLNKYGNYVSGFLIQRGSYPVYVGKAIGPTASSWGIDNAGEWSMAAIVRYRSLRTLMQLATDPKFKELHKNKVAAIAKTIAYPTQVKLQLGSLQVLVFFILLSMALATQLLISTRMRRN